MFVLSADKNNLKVSQYETITSGSVNVYQVRFVFDSDWDGMDRVAVFRVGSQKTSVILGEDNECQIPRECLQRYNEWDELYCGVYGVIGTEIVLPTVWVLLGTIQEGASLGDNTTPTTPSIAEQVLSEVINERRKAESAADRAEEAAERAENAAAGGGGAEGTGNVYSDEIYTIKALDRAEYEALTEKSPTTLYLIRG